MKISSFSPSRAGPCGLLAPPALAMSRNGSRIATSVRLNLIDRRDLIASIGLISLPLSFTSSSAVHAEEDAEASFLSSPTKKPNVFFDISIEGEDIGRIVVETFDEAPMGAQRFKDLAVGGVKLGGVGYRRSRVDGIFPTHIRVEGAALLSYSATGESLIAGGDSIADLQAEMTLPSRRLHDQSGLVSLLVEEDKERPVTEKLVARDGKLVTVQYQAGEAPNGTGFVITRGPAPQLDRVNLVIGHVVEGMDIVERIAALPYSKPREDWYDGPFFAAGKAIGDKRATVAEKGFNRPFKRVVVKKCGVL